MVRLLALAWLLPFAAHGYQLRLDAAGDPVSWANSPTFVMSPALAQSLGDPDAAAAARAAVATYAAALPQLGATFQLGTTHGIGFDPAAGAANQNAIVEIAQDWPYDANAIAVTILTVDPETHEILDADIALNTASHAFRSLPASSEPGGPYDDLQNTLTHELGHALGLAHNNDDPTVVMYPGAPKGQVSKRALAPDDEAGLAFLYADFTSPNGASPRGLGCGAAPEAPLAVALAALVRVLSRRPWSGGIRGRGRAA